MMKPISALCAALALATPAWAASEGTPIKVTGELIDTWCYYSGVMGPPEAVTGSAHHTCALWCSAGGIPVGLLGEDGTLYMVLKVGQDDQAAGGEGLLRMAAHTVEADGMLYKRDGLNYIVVSQVVSDLGLTNQNHDEWGNIPPFSIPKSARQ